MKIKMYLYQKETKYTQVEPDAVLVYDNVRELTVKKIPKETILETSDEKWLMNLMNTCSLNLMMQKDSIRQHTETAMWMFSD